MTPNSNNTPSENLLRWAGVNSAWDMISYARRYVHSMYLWGPPGVGKSHAALSGAGATQCTLSEDLVVQELIGNHVPDGDTFRWHDGPIARSMRGGGVLVLNEITRASDSVRDFLLGVLDDPTVASIALPTGEHLKPEDGFLVIATANHPPDLLDPALRSRFEVEIHIDRPHPRVIQMLNSQIAGLGDALDDSYQDPERALDPRKVLYFCKLIRSGIRYRSAAAMVFGLRAPDIVAALSTRGVGL